jgi:hypothetical protein
MPRSPQGGFEPLAVEVVPVPAAPFWAPVPEVPAVVEAEPPPPKPVGSTMTPPPQARSAVEATRRTASEEGRAAWIIGDERNSPGKAAREKQAQAKRGFLGSAPAGIGPSGYESSGPW